MPNTPPPRPSRCFLKEGYPASEVDAYIDHQAQRIADLKREVSALRQSKDGAYRERNQLVAALSKLFPSWLQLHPSEDAEWEDDWRTIVFIDSPAGQLSWHLHDSEVGLFDHLEWRDGRSWDGHTTEEKYRRLAAIEFQGNAALRAEVERLREAGDCRLRIELGIAISCIEMHHDDPCPWCRALTPDGGSYAER